MATVEDNEFKAEPSLGRCLHWLSLPQILNRKLKSRCIKLHLRLLFENEVKKAAKNHKRLIVRQWPTGLIFIQNSIQFYGSLNIVLRTKRKKEIQLEEWLRCILSEIKAKSQCELVWKITTFQRMESQGLCLKKNWFISHSRLLSCVLRTINFHYYAIQYLQLYY